jgi:hypothetical protein
LQAWNDSTSLPATPGQRRGAARPAVSAEAVARLPRWPLWLLCLAYLLPGFIGRDPWTGDATTFATIWQLAQGHAAWLAPGVYGHDVGGGWLAYWLGALSVQGLGPWLGAVGASRVPFVALLALTLLQTWYAAYHFALGEPAQPVTPAFAEPIPAPAYARAMADGALLSLVACLGLLVHGHETIPELAQLAGASGLLLGLALLQRRAAAAALTFAAALLLLGADGEPLLACGGALTAGLLMVHPQARRLAAPAAIVLGAGLLGMLALLHTLPQSWTPYRFAFDNPQHFLSTFAWFVWPAWPLALWGLWRWRESIGAWHVLAPLALALLALLHALLEPHNPSALLLLLPAAALLAALALPVMRRASLAALDWFALMFFSLLALVVWVLWLAMLTGVPAKPAANVARLAPGFHAHFTLLPTLLALLGTLAWAALVAWRAGRHRHPLWKGMVLSAGGVTLVWLLVGTLWLPVLDYASSYRGIGQDLGAALRQRAPAGVTVGTLCLSPAQLGLLGYWSGAALDAHARGTAYLLIREGAGRHRSPAEKACAAAPDAAPGTLLWAGHRPGEPEERFALYRRATP